MFSDLQKEIGLWKPTRKKFDGKTARRKHLCFKCLEKGFSVKMDYIHNRHEKSVNCVYNVDYFECPRCKQIYKEKVRIVGKGISRNNLGKVAGGE